MAGDDDKSLSGEINTTGAFSNLQSAFSSTQRARPFSMEVPGESVENRVPLKPNKLHRQESKGVLRGLFTRNKVDKKVVLPVLEEPAAASERSHAMTEKNLIGSNSLKKVATLPASTPAAPSTPHTPSKASRMNLRSKSVKYTNPTSKPSPKSSTKSSPKRPTRTSAAWDPPPLFQAYPQAIKHATLSASTLSADAILRISSHKRTNSLRDDFAENRSSENGTDQSAAVKKAEKAKTRHRRQLSGSITKSDWTQKIFVLVTSGYLLQYAGEGSFDRLPEKMMQLGKDSVAFASDVIPGKHWVLQISQSMNADGTPTADSRSFLSRLAFRGIDYRRTATSILLVLNSAEDLDSWIAVVRREIEALGGKKHVSETGKPKPDDKVMQLKAQPSHRYLIRRDSDQFSNPASPSSLSFGPVPWTKKEQLQDRLEDSASVLSQPLSTIRPSTGHRSIATSIISHDGRQLESLRDSGNRLSHTSSGQRTFITSQCSSATSSPTRETYPSFDELPPKISVDDARPRPNAAAINERRRSMQTMQIPAFEAPSQLKNHRHSTFVPNRPPRSHSPAAPNFSTPKRSSRILVPETPPVPTIVTTTLAPSNARNSTLKGTRKGPPPALKVVQPIEDSLSKRAATVLSPKESSFRMAQQVKATVVRIPSRSPSTSSTRISSAEPPPRRSSRVPLNSTEMAHLDFQFPKRFSSMQAPYDAVDLASEPPVRPAPLAPTALTTTTLSSSSYYPEPEISTTHDHEIEKEVLSPLPILANSKRKLRRPTSMQIRPPSSTPISVITTKAPKSQLVSQNHRESRHRPLSPSTTSSAPTAVISPSFQRLMGQDHPKAVANRRSMPTLVSGPPPAPPPDCALPPLPPGSAGFKSPMSVRSSVRVG